MWFSFEACCSTRELTKHLPQVSQFELCLPCWKSPASHSVQQAILVAGDNRVLCKACQLTCLKSLKSLKWILCTCRLKTVPALVGIHNIETKIDMCVHSVHIIYPYIIIYVYVLPLIAVYVYLYIILFILSVWVLRFRFISMPHSVALPAPSWGKRGANPAFMHRRDKLWPKCLWNSSKEPLLLKNVPLAYHQRAENHGTPPRPQRACRLARRLSLDDHLPSIPVCHTWSNSRSEARCSPPHYYPFAQIRDQQFGQSATQKFPKMPPLRWQYWGFPYSPVSRRWQIHEDWWVFEVGNRTCSTCQNGRLQPVTKRMTGLESPWTLNGHKMPQLYRIMRWYGIYIFNIQVRIFAVLLLQYTSRMPWHNALPTYIPTFGFRALVCMQCRAEG